MSKRVTIVMYHFVRDLQRSRYPRIKGLEAEAFAGQLGYIRRHYRVVRMEDVIAASIDPQRTLPERALLLTFDDGYADHYRTVFPILDRFGWQGSFFPPARAVLERRVLDVNKIHFLLAAVDEPTRLGAALDAHIVANREAFGLESPAHYREVYAQANRWDPAEVMYVKRVLQKGLPDTLRFSMTDQLFREFVSTDEEAFADELYVSLEQLRRMRRHGMHVGSHSYDHVWLDTLTPDEQFKQVRGSMRFLEQVGCDMTSWTIAYPYGGVNRTLTSVLADLGCRVGLTTEAAIADLDASPPLNLGRIDTNDLPIREDAPRSEWTSAAATQRARPAESGSVT